jgi:hypothetical protein
VITFGLLTVTVVIALGSLALDLELALRSWPPGRLR